jgi:succinoglycan biosynthesis transport protein ExoP
MDLIYFLRVLLKRKWLILAIVSIAVITTFLITYKAPKVYKAHARIATGISEQENLIFSSKGIRSPQRYEIEAKFHNMVEMMRSPRVLSLVSYRLMLHDLQQETTFRLAPHRQLLAKYSSEEFKVAEEQFISKLDSLQPLIAADELDKKHLQMLSEMGYDANSLAKRLDVQRIPGTDYIGIDFHAETPQMAAFVTNQLCREFIRYYTDVSASRASSSIAFHGAQLNEKKAEYYQKLKEYEDYQAALGTQNSPSAQDNRAMIQRIDQLQDLRTQINQELFVVNRDLKEANALLDLDEPIWNPAEGRPRGEDQVNALRQQIRKIHENTYLLNQEIGKNTDTGSLIEQMLELLTEGNSTKVSEAQLNILRQKIRSEIAVDIAQEKISLLDQALKKLGDNEAGQLLTEEANSLLGKEVAQARDAYFLALSKYSEDRLNASGSYAGPLSQVDFVYPPEKGEPSRPPLLIVLSGLVSLALCIVVLFILEYLDTSVKYPSRFQELTGMPILGLLNRLNTSNLDLVSLFNETQKNHHLETYKQLLRKIRYELVESGAQSILVTSTKEGTGKTALLVSLAYSLSLNGKRVLLIDTNFKGHALTDITAASPTLEAFIKGKISREALISSSVLNG